MNGASGTSDMDGKAARVAVPQPGGGGINVRQIYEGSDGEATKALYAALEKLGPIGLVALNLFRCHKSSSRAKVYRRRAHKHASYDKKNWSLGELCNALINHGGFVWGWQEDPTQEFHKWVLYVELPTGQVSFHARLPYTGHRYAGEWDGRKVSGERIIRFVESVLNGTRVRPQRHDTRFLHRYRIRRPHAP